MEEREAEPYNERLVMENIVAAGPNTIKAHLEHLKSHGEDKLYAEAIEVLKRKTCPFPKRMRANATPWPAAARHLCALHG